MQPAVTYASEIQGLTHTTLAVLEKGARAAVPYSALVVPKSLGLYAVPTTKLPLYDQFVVPLLRWAKEVWLVLGPGHHLAPQGDDCTLDEPRSSWRQVNAGLLGTRDSESNLFPPLAPLQFSLQKLQWKFPGPTTFLIATGTQLDISVLPPAQLKTYMAHDVDGIRDSYHEFKHGPQDNNLSLDWHFLRAALRS
jgi:hypothetical protein